MSTPDPTGSQVVVNVEKLLQLTQAKLALTLNEALMWETAYWEVKATLPPATIPVFDPAASEANTVEGPSS